MRTSPLLKLCIATSILGLSLSGLGLTLAVTGCSFVERTADGLASVTAGTPVSGLASGIARTAESFKDYSPSQEHFIGRSVAAEILSRYSVHKNDALQEYVNLVGQAVLMAPEAGKTLTGFHFVVVDGDELQAVSTPGGFVFLTVGTVQRAKDEDELASVLAHEVAHVTLKHGIKSIKAATRKQAAALLVKGVGETAVAASGQSSAETKDLVELTSAFGNAIQDITGDLLVKGYSRETELEADSLAVQILKSSGYARAALASYLKGVGADKAGGKGGWTGTHPSPEDRVAALGDVGTGAAIGRDVRKERFAKSLGG